MVRIQEGSGGGRGEFGGRRSSKDMRRDSADTRDREKPRTVANMRERDRTLRWEIIFSHILSPPFFYFGNQKLILLADPTFEYLNTFAFIRSPCDVFIGKFERFQELMHHLPLAAEGIYLQDSSIP